MIIVMKSNHRALSYHNLSYKVSKFHKDMEQDLFKRKDQQQDQLVEGLVEQSIKQILRTIVLKTYHN